MPKVMDNLMPHMIGDVVPLVTGPMVDYLQRRRPQARPLSELRRTHRRVSLKGTRRGERVQ